MTERTYRYIIVGGGLTGNAAAEGIREIDEGGSILLIGSEPDLPYDRPPLTKKLWFGQKKVEDIFLHDTLFYTGRNIDLLRGREVTVLDRKAHTITDSHGRAYKYQKLMLATGGNPRKLRIPGGDIEGLSYYRYIEDYRRIRKLVSNGVEVVVIGGGFIGAEIAAALNRNGARVTMLCREPHLLHRVFPDNLAAAIENDYTSRGVTMLMNTAPASIEKTDDSFVTTTGLGRKIVSSIVIAGIGIEPSVELAGSAGLDVDNGIVVNEFMQTSDNDIFAGGDNAFFPYEALARRMRIEHWDNAIAQGRHAGRAMAGSIEPFTYMPYFFSDLFDFGFEAVGNVDSRLDIEADWQIENEKGIVWYLSKGRPEGVMICNIWDKVESAREWIRKGEKVHLGDALRVPA